VSREPRALDGPGIHHGGARPARHGGKRRGRPEWLATHVMGLVNAPDAVSERLAAALLGADPRVHRLANGSWGLVPRPRGVPLLEECAFRRGGRGDDRRELPHQRPDHEDRRWCWCGERPRAPLRVSHQPRAPDPGLRQLGTGITDHMVGRRPGSRRCGSGARGAIGRIFVAHNVRFDWAFVSSELRRARGVRLDGPRLCTVRLARRLVPSAESCSLGALSYHFAFENQARHRRRGCPGHRGAPPSTGGWPGHRARTLPELEVLAGTAEAPKKRARTRGSRHCQTRP
jgi:hypothetical protein